MKIETIYVHGFDTPKDMDVTRDHLHRWHVIENGWSDVGYHWWINRQGQLQAGRPDYIAGAGVAGHNQNALHIGMAGGRPDFNYTGKQLRVLRTVIDSYVAKWPEAVVKGHRDAGGTGKTCPGFDVAEWYYND